MSPRRRDPRPDAPTPNPPGTVLAILLGDQLDRDSNLIRSLDPSLDTILMMEVREESTHVPSHVQRTVLFLSAMRHMASDLRRAGFDVRYVALDDPSNTHTFAGEIRRAAQTLRPGVLRCIEPGDHRVAAALAEAARTLGVPLDTLLDEHFLTSDAQFADWAKGRKTPLVMEHFYRVQRKRLGVLVDARGQPEGGVWNFDTENRERFSSSGPSPRPPRPRRFKPDKITRDVIATVRRTLPDLPGSCESFGWPVTPADARRALDDFIRTRLPLFGPYEDAMWTGEPWVYHSQLSPPLNLKLLDPRDCVDAAVDAYASGHTPLQSVEAFVRQIIGWREFIRGVYRLEGSAYTSRNSLGHTGLLPGFYWTGDTDMNCLRHALRSVLDHAYGHHIERLMITGNFALVAGVHPRAISDWYLGMYADAVDWATLPNTLGMAMHADAREGSTQGVVGTKPYCASGRYIQRMSNYCTGCAYDPARRTGQRACPITTFYWDFLLRHESTFARNPRMTMMLKHVSALTPAQRVEITVHAKALRERLGIDPAAPASTIAPSSAPRSLWEAR